MTYNFSDDINSFLKNIEEEIIKEYDSAPETKVVVKLLPISHNTFSEFEKIKGENGETKVTVNPQNRENVSTYVVVHETTPNQDKDIPRKPAADDRNLEHYELLLKRGRNDYEYGDTIGYHALISCDKETNENQIILYLPAITSPDQVGNVNMTPFVYGIERLVHEGQNFHLAIANQAMLSAFYLSELGYNKNQILSHVFPHKFYAKNRKDCPARMLYATKLIEETKSGKQLTDEEKAIIEEYVPWQVFMNLIKTFALRKQYPKDLKDKFIFDLEDYEAYQADPISYNYQEQKSKKNIVIKKDGIIDFSPVKTEPVDYNTEEYMKIDIKRGLKH